jgi:hypothetical protein
VTSRVVGVVFSGGFGDLYGNWSRLRWPASCLVVVRLSNVVFSGGSVKIPSTCSPAGSVVAVAPSMSRRRNSGDFWGRRPLFGSKCSLCPIRNKDILNWNRISRLVLGPDPLQPNSLSGWILYNLAHTSQASWTQSNRFSVSGQPDPPHLIPVCPTPVQLTGSDPLVQRVCFKSGSECFSLVQWFQTQFRVFQTRFS